MKDFENRARILAEIKTLIASDKPIEAKRVAEILNDFGDIDLGRSLIANYLVQATLQGKVSEVFIWGAVLAYLEDKRPDTDVQAELMRFITYH
jgi:ABC-type microcin C transport system permease subunit YejB